MEMTMRLSRADSEPDVQGDRVAAHEDRVLASWGNADDGDLIQLDDLDDPQPGDEGASWRAGNLKSW
jgi:hypothetical protein